MKKIFLGLIVLCMARLVCPIQVADAGELQILLTYYKVDAIEVVNKIKDLQDQYVEEKKDVSFDEKESLKYNYYKKCNDIFAENSSPLFKHITVVQENNQISDNAHYDEIPLEVNYKVESISDNRIPVEFDIQYDNKTLYKGNPLLLQLDKPFRILQSGPYILNNGKGLVTALFVEVNS